MNAPKFLLILMAALTMTSTDAGNIPRSPTPNSAEYKAIASTASAGANAQLKATITLDVETLNIAGDWAFVTAQLLGKDGTPYDYSGTDLEEGAKAGGVSRTYAGLLRLRDGHWAIITQAIGPTDVIWETWTRDFGAPTALFATD